MFELAPGVYTFQRLLVGRVYLLTAGDGLTIIDAGLGLAPGRITRQLKASGYDPGDVTRILVTHAHPDHVGGLPELQQITGAEVITSRIEAPYVEGKQPIPRAGDNTTAPTKGTPVTRTVEDGEVIEEVAGGLQVIYTPGHSPGHTSYWLESEKVLFCGDVIMHMLGIMTLPFAVATPDMEENKRSIRKLAAQVVPDVIGFGHGPALTGNAAASLSRFASKWSE